MIQLHNDSENAAIIIYFLYCITQKLGMGRLSQWLPKVTIVVVLLVLLLGGLQMKSIRSESTSLNTQVT